MATRRRDAFPGKEKAATPSPQTGTAKLRGAVNQTSKPKVSTAPQKQTRPAASRTTPTTDVSKTQTRKPASPATAAKPAQTRTRSLDTKAATPVQKTRVVAAASTRTPTASTRTPATATATGAAHRAASLPVKAVAAPKPAPAKKWKPVEKEEGKRRLSSSSVGSGRRSSIGLKKESGRSSLPAAKEQRIPSLNLDKNEDLSIYCVPEPEMQLQDIDSYLAEAEEKTVQSLSDFEKGMDDFVKGDQEPMNYSKIEAVTDPTVVAVRSSTVSEQQEPPVDIKTQESESSHKHELEHEMNETNSCDKVEKIADNSHEEARAKEVKVLEVAAAVSKAVEFKEIEPAAEKKQENLVAQRQQQEKIHGKYDSPVSNDVIEETANKLREMRRNKVRALAGAFETVISLQDK